MSAMTRTTERAVLLGLMHRRQAPCQPVVGRGRGKPANISDHYYPLADRKCKCCGYTLASAFPELWDGDRCVFCAEDCEPGNGR